ncbi:MAG TPA: response regulator transcription factor [Blastocatellia bacterium]|nr:response regulator transcription factor [Blastocatellia bacterium]
MENDISMSSPTRVMLVHHHRILRAGLRLLIEGHSGFSVVGEAGNPSEAVSIVRREQPDIIVLDLVTEPAPWIDLIPKLLSISSSSRILALADEGAPDLNMQVVQQGAMGLVFQNEPPDVLIRAIEKLQAGQVWLERTLVANVLAQISRRNSNNGSEPEIPPAIKLTKRERDIIALVTAGCKNKQIAARLAISDVTVRHHLTTIYSKLNVEDRFELIIYAYRNGLAEPPA